MVALAGYWYNCYLYYSYSPLQFTFYVGEKMLDKNQVFFDAEANSRKIIQGTNNERRWRSPLEVGLIYRLRRSIAVLFEKFIACLIIIKCYIDSWRATPESVTEHHHKQFFLMTRMMLIENKKGDEVIRQKLDFIRLLVWANFHDLAEGHDDFYDVHYHIKRANLEVRKKFDEIEARCMAEILENIFSIEYQSEYSTFSIGRIDYEKNKDDQVIEIFWQAAEHISHCLFMLEEIKLRKISRERRKRFHNDVYEDHIHWLTNNAWHFASVREIVEKELLPKWVAVSGNV